MNRQPERRPRRGPPKGPTSQNGARGAPPFKRPPHSQAAPPGDPQGRPSPASSLGASYHRGRAPERQRAGPPPARGEAPAGSWEHVASWYDSLVGERGTDFQRTVILPGLLRLLDLKPRETVFDVACGQGAISLGLAETGVGVTGVDLSPALIARAKERASERVRFLVGDARRLSMLQAGAFDAAVCVLAAQNIDPIEPVFAECGRLLRRGGRAVFVVPHPAFRIPRQSSWQWDEPRKLLYREVDRYLEPLKVPIDMRPFRQPGATLTWTYHRPVGFYVNGLAASGLLTNALEEWTSQRTSQPGPRAAAENRARQEFPLFLAVRVVKV